MHHINKHLEEGGFEDIRNETEFIGQEHKDRVPQK